jgi:hypothetical protein
MTTDNQRADAVVRWTSLQRKNAPVHFLALIENRTTMA